MIARIRDIERAVSYRNGFGMLELCGQIANPANTLNPLQPVLLRIIHGDTALLAIQNKQHTAAVHGQIGWFDDSLGLADNAVKGIGKHAV